MGPEAARALTSAGRHLVRVVASLPPDAWERPTGCEVSVRELVEHVVAGNEFAVRLLAGADADTARRGIDEVRLGADPAAQLAASCAAQLAAFGAADPDRLLHHPSGDLELTTFVRLRLAELVVHGWDVAVAAGLDTTMEPQSAQALWNMVAAAGEELGPPGAYRATVPLPADAPLQDRLLAAFGRAAR